MKPKSKPKFKYKYRIDSDGDYKLDVFVDGEWDYFGLLCIHCKSFYKVVWDSGLIIKYLEKSMGLKKAKARFAEMAKESLFCTNCGCRK